MGMPIDQKIVLVTRPTQLAALKQKFATRAQAKFQMVSSKKRELSRSMKSASSAVVEQLAEAAFGEVDRAADVYDSSVSELRRELDQNRFGVPVQAVNRDFLPNFVFGPNDIIVTVGQDGLVANVAKYAVGLPIVAVNPDPARIDGVLLPFRAEGATAAVNSVLNGKAKYREITLAEATLPNGQHLLAFNELFIGARSHISARYQLTAAGRTEPQSSSGVLVCTGAGSTGWLSSVFNMARGISALGGQTVQQTPLRMEWEDPRLMYVVREPFASRSSQCNLVAGLIEPGQDITIESDMAASGVIFSDGVESDFLEFNAGTIARIRTAAGKAKLVVA